MPCAILANLAEARRAISGSLKAVRSCLKKFSRVKAVVSLVDLHPRLHELRGLSDKSTIGIPYLIGTVVDELAIPSDLGPSG